MARTPSSAAVHIGELIAGHRKGRKMTIDQLAVAAGIDSSNVRSYESGRSMLSIPTLVRLAEALGVEPAHLLDGVSVDMLAERVPRGQG